MPKDCIFCQIAAGELPAETVYETDSVLAFRDVKPVAPTHILIIPRQHIVAPSALDTDSAQLMGEIFLAAGKVAEQEGLTAGGYRLVMNEGRDGGQSVFHMHLHLLGGRRMTWPPG